jgi:peptide/nickel transport system substrate-binding protein
MGSRMKSRVRRRRSAVGLIGFAFVALALTGSTAIASSGPDSVRWSAATAHKCLVATGSGDPAFVRNFNPYVQGLPSSSFVRGGMYEPLTITTPAAGGREYKWLAQSYAWSKDGKTLTLQIRRNVKWSDGKPLTAADVVYSLTAGKQDKTMDILGAYREGSNIASVRQKGTHQVVIRLKTKDSQFVAVNLNAIFVVPKHVFSKVADINKWTNPKPVGSGPFTQVGRFNAQVYVLNKNPNYWRPGRPKIACLQYIQATSNDAALLQIRSGQADWTHNFVPNVEKAYIAKDPKHFHAFYDTTAYPISLMFDTESYPYSLVPFRKAVSMAIDRQKVSKLGEYGYAPPTDAIGIKKLFPSWQTDASVNAEAKRLGTYNQTAAKKLLTDNGFKYQGDKLYDPKGNRVGFQIHVISGWSDWVASLQIISKNLQDIGIDASVKLEPDWGSWYPNATSTKFVTLLWQTAAVGSPYGFFFNNMHENTYLPSGQDAVNTGNFAHFKDTSATKLLDQWKSTLDVNGQKRIATQVQKAWLQKLPVIPLFIGPQWSTYSTKYFHCFPTPRNHYARPIYNTYPENAVLLTTICPGGRAENTPIQ